jgi:hypothetical protein
MTDDIVKLSPLASLNPLQLRSMRLDYLDYAPTEREPLSRGRLGLRLDEYAAQKSAVLLSECTSELQNACSLAPSIDEDHNFRKFGDACLACVARKPVQTAERLLCYIQTFTRI